MIMNNWKTYLIVGLCGVIAFLWIRSSQHVCPYIENEVVKYDTHYVSSSPLVIKTKPKNTVIEKPVYIKGKNIIDTFLKVVYEKNQSTFTSIDTAFRDSTFVAILDSGNCSGILNRRVTWGGKEKVVQKTVTRTISAPISVFSLYGGAKVSFKDSVSDISPSLMLLYKQNTAFEYEYGLLTNQHKAGIKIKLLRK